MSSDPIPSRPPGGDPDADLVRALAAGSGDALGALFSRHKDFVFWRAYRIMASAEDAEDVLQDVFVGLGRALERYVEQGSFQAWLGSVTTRAALMRLRARRRRPLGSVASKPEVAAPAGPDPLDRMTVRRALEAMPEGQRLVFVLKEIEGYSHSEIAELLDIRVTSSKVRLHRAWRFLERRIGRLS